MLTMLQVAHGHCEPSAVSATLVMQPVPFGIGTLLHHIE